MINALTKFHQDERGQGMAEYGLIVALVAVVCIVGFQLMGKAVGSKVQKVGDTINK